MKAKSMKGNENRRSQGRSIQSFRVLLANPPWRENDRLGIRAGSRWPFSVPARGRRRLSYVPFPFYIAYAASLLEREGVEILVIDAVAEGMTEEEFIRRVSRFSPQLAVVECSTPSFATDLRISKAIRAAVAPSPVVALAGPHPTALASEIAPSLEEGFLLLIGEYEETLLHLVRLISRGEEPRTRPGMVRCGTGAVGRIERAPLADVDRLPFPARHRFPIYVYNDDFGVLPKPNVQMWASRGCTFRCSFCLWPQVMYGGPSYRPRDIDEVIREMEYLVSMYGFKAVYFDDDTFNIDEKRMITLAKKLITRRFTTPWAAMARADTTSLTTLALMREAGLVGMKFGVESGSQEILNRCNKSLELSAVERTVEACKQLGIKTHLTFTIGLPGETWESIEKTLSFALRLDPDSAQFSIATPFPGTEFFRRAVEQRDLRDFDWTRFDGYRTAGFGTSQLSPESLERGLSLLLQQWRSHQRKRRAPTTPETARSSPEPAVAQAGGKT